MIWPLVVVALSAQHVPAPTRHEETCTASVFGMRGDRWSGGDTLWLRRPVGPDDIGIAHRTRPLGSWVIVRNVRTGRELLVRVIDRGPYGRTDDRGWYNGAPSLRARNKGRRGKYRGCVDLTPRAAELLGHNGLETVVIR